MKQKEKIVPVQSIGDAKSIDGFVNFGAKMGVGANNLLSEGTYCQTGITRNRSRLEAAYRGSWIVGAMVDSFSEDMTRSGIEIIGEIDPSDATKLQRQMTRLGVWNSLLDFVKWSRLYGGAIAVIGIDGQDLSTPFDAKTVSRESFTGLTIYDRWTVTPDMHDLVRSGCDMGLPASYTITAMGPSLKVHHSRVIRGIGIQLPYWQAQIENYWGESLVERIYDRLMAFDTATSGAANLLQQAYLRTVQVDRLREILAMGNQAQKNLEDMFATVAKMQSATGLTLLDGKDTFQTSSYSFAGMADIILQFGQQISGATGIPLVRLFGQSPAGLNSTGESDLRMYYDNIKAQQESRLRSGMHRILDVLHRSVLGAPPDDSFDFEFCPLWQMDATEKSNIAKVNVDTVIAAMDAGIITPAIAMAELKQSSAATGVFTNIKDDDIAGAVEELPPSPEEIEPIGSEFSSEKIDNGSQKAF